MGGVTLGGVALGGVLLGAPPPSVHRFVPIVIAVRPEVLPVVEVGHDVLGLLGGGGRFGVTS